MVPVVLAAALAMAVALPDPSVRTGPSALLRLANGGDAMAADLEGDWVVTEVVGGPAIGGNPPTLNFTGGRLYGFGGCNALQAEVTLAPGAMMFGPVTGGNANCDGPALELEGAVKRALGSANGHAVEGGVLTLLSYGNPVLRARR